VPFFVTAVPHSAELAGRCFKERGIGVVDASVEKGVLVTPGSARGLHFVAQRNAAEGGAVIVNVELSAGARLAEPSFRNGVPKLRFLLGDAPCFAAVGAGAGPGAGRSERTAIECLAIPFAAGGAHDHLEMLLLVDDGDLAFVQEDRAGLFLRHIAAEAPIKQTAAAQDKLLLLAERVGALRVAMRGQQIQGMSADSLKPSCGWWDDFRLVSC